MNQILRISKKRLAELERKKELKTLNVLTINLIQRNGATLLSISVKLPNNINHF